jgi:hypothetical protein
VESRNVVLLFVNKSEGIPVEIRCFLLLKLRIYIWKMVNIEEPVFVGARKFFEE